MSAPLHCIELPYQTDSASLFTRIADRPWAVFLDSNFPACAGHPGSRYDILTADPHETLVVRGDVAEIRGTEGVVRSHGIRLRCCASVWGRGRNPSKTFLSRAAPWGISPMTWGGG